LRAIALSSSHLSLTGVAVEKLFSGNFDNEIFRKLLNVRSPQMLEFAEVTALVPFSTPTGVYAQNPVVSVMIP
jgi:hypothetical protein